MKVEVEELGPLKKMLKVEVPEEEFSAAVKKEYDALRPEASVQGFRKGKVPEHILRQKFGKQVLGDVARRLIERTYPDAVKESGLKVIGMPDVDIKNLSEGSALVYSAIVDIMPDIDPETYRNIEVKREPVEVTEEEMERNLDMLRERNGQFKDVDRGAGTGDLVTVDFECSVDGEPLKGAGRKDYRFIIGDEGAILPEFEEVAKGAKAGEVRQFTKPFPATYHDKRVAGKDAVFSVRIKSVKEKVLPALDDDFAKDLMCESLDELKDKVREEIRRVKEKAEKERLQKEVLEKIEERNPFDVPESLVDRYYVQVMNNVLDGVRKGLINPMGIDVISDESKKRYREMAEKQARGDIVLDAIADREDIQATDEDVNKAIEEMASVRGESAEAIRARFEEQKGAMAALRDSIRRNKVFDMLLEEKKIVVPGA